MFKCSVITPVIAYIILVNIWSINSTPYLVTETLDGDVKGWKCSIVAQYNEVFRWLAVLDFSVWLQLGKQVFRILV